MFKAAEPDQRYVALERFYRLPLRLIEKFYSMRLNIFEYALFLLWGRSPVPIARGLRCLREATSHD